MTEKKVILPPYSEESEKLVLGSMLTSTHGFQIGADALDSSDFYYSEHRLIFDVLKRRYRQEQGADIHLIAEDLKSIDSLDSIGGMIYLVDLAQFVGTSAYVEEYVEVVRSKSILRRMIRAAQEIEASALKDPRDVRKSLDEAQGKLFAISQRDNRTAGTPIKDFLVGVHASSELPFLKGLEKKQEIYQEKGEEALTGIPSGFPDLDRLIHGLNRSQLIICAGRPAMGKTAFALNIATHACFTKHLPVGIFSLEMSMDQLVYRMLSAEAHVEAKKMVMGSLNGEEYQKIYQKVRDIEGETMVIDDHAGLDIADLRVRARRMKEVHDIQLLIVDYIQLLSGSSNYSYRENRQQELSEISRMMKGLARELDLPVLCLCQLSRKVEERQGRRPVMSDIRDSGAIEQDADVVLLLFRRDYYDPQDKPGMGEVIVGKNRHGSTGIVEVTYLKEFAKFVSYTPTER